MRHPTETESPQLRTRMMRAGSHDLAKEAHNCFSPNLQPPRGSLLVIPRWSLVVRLAVVRRWLVGSLACWLVGSLARWLVGSFCRWMVVWQFGRWVVSRPPPGRWVVGWLHQQQREARVLGKHVANDRSARTWKQRVALPRSMK